MNKTTAITVAALAVVAIAGGIMAVDTPELYNADAAALSHGPVELAQAPAPPATPLEAAAGIDSASAERDANEAPEVTAVSGTLIKADESPVSGGVIYFVFQGRLNELPHANPMEKVKAMHETTAAVDAQGSFTLKMKPGNFAMIYDPAATEVPSEPGPESMDAMKRLTPEQVQARIAAIKENAAKGLPIKDGKLGEAFVIENRYIRPPVSDFGELQLQSDATVIVKALDDNGELINFPATLRLRGKNGDIMEPHTPSVAARAQYEFHHLMPQSYQVFSLGTLPPPGAGDQVTTPVVENDQLIFTGESLTHEVVVKPGSAEAQ